MPLKHRTTDVIWCWFCMRSQCNFLAIQVDKMLQLARTIECARANVIPNQVTVAPVGLISANYAFCPSIEAAVLRFVNRLAIKLLRLPLDSLMLIGINIYKCQKFLLLWSILFCFYNYAIYGLFLLIADMVVLCASRFTCTQYTHVNVVSEYGWLVLLQADVTKSRIIVIKSHWTKTSVAGVCLNWSVSVLRIAAEPRGSVSLRRCLVVRTRSAPGNTTRHVAVRWQSCPGICQGHDV